YTVMKPSSSTWISWPSIVVMGMSVLQAVFAGHGHVRRERDGTTGQQDVPVDPAEGQLAEVVGPGLLEQSHRPDHRHRVPPGQRLGVVVEVDEQRLVVPTLHEAVGMA